LGKNGKTNANSRKKCRQQKKFQNFEIKNFKIKRLLQLNKISKLILIISKLDT
jgi:hypothetical protein